MAAAQVNLLQLPITFPLNKTDHNLSLSLRLYAELAAITALLEWEINGVSACMCAFDLCTVVYVSSGRAIGTTISQ